MNKDKLDNTIDIAVVSREMFKHISILYSNTNYLLPDGVSYLDVLKENLSEKEYKEYYRSFLPRQKKISDKLRKKIELLNIPDKLRYYNLEDGQNCYLYIDYKNSFYHVGTTLISFLNTNFNNFSEYFVWFAKFFASYINLFDEQDIENLKINTFYTYSEIETIARKYYIQIKTDATRVQKLYSEFIDYIFNLDAIDKLKDMTNQMRFYIFYKSHLKQLNKYVTNYKTTDSFSYQIVPDYDEDNEEKLIHFFTSKEHFADVIAETSAITNSVYSMLYITLFQFVENNQYFIKKCKNCSKYFITDNVRVNYCDNLFKGTQTCKDIGNQIAQRIKQENDKVYGKYRKIYSKKAMLVKRNPDIEVYKRDYEIWKKEAKEYMDAIRNEKKTYEEFDKWLNENM